MPIRWYLAPYVQGSLGNRTVNASKIFFLARAFGEPSAHVSVVKANPWKSWCLTRLDGTDPLHSSVQADAEVTLIPLWDSLGEYLAMSDTVGEIDSVYRQQMANFLEARRVPLGWVTVGMQIRLVIRIIIRIMQMVQMMGNNFPDLDLDDTVGDIPSAQRQAVQDWMDNNGIDTSEIVLTTPIRAVLKRIFDEYPWRPQQATIGGEKI